MNIERVSLPNRPALLSPMDAVLDCRYDGDQYARVILEMSDAPDDNFQIKAQAYEMTADGQYVQAPKGYPSRTRQTAHTFHKSALGDTSTLSPGWVRLPPPSGVTYSIEAGLPGGATAVAELPESGIDGEMVYWEGKLLQWNKGIVNTILETKVSELRTVLRNTAPLSNLGFAH